ncbi:MAG: hypothetical protein AAGJ69_11090, partial [Cyanobacteria bacterium J06559_1]
MNPTTLNLLAVSVFAFTLLSLVGPLLNISPGAVAITLTGCVGILALDRFSWQGKGGNLLVDLVSGQSSEYRQRILHHEAGHFLVAHLLDIPVESYTLSAWEGIKAGLPGLGGVVVDTSAINLSEKSLSVTSLAQRSENGETADGEMAAGQTGCEKTGCAKTGSEQPESEDPESEGPKSEGPESVLSPQQINRYCILWMAGIAAECQTYGNAQGGDDDKAQLRRLWLTTQPSLKQLTPAATATALETQTRWALLQAQALLKKQQVAYGALVSAMANND